LKPTINLDVYLVDDGSTDDTSLYVKQAFPSVKIIQGTGNLFWNRGMHLAWEIAAKTKSYDFYLLLNDDTIIFDSAIQQIFNDSQTLEHKAIICGTTHSQLSLTEVTYGGHKKGQFRLKPNGAPQKCDYFNGNCVLIPNSVYQQVGNLDPFYHHSLGDFDYGIRAKDKGIESYVASTFVGTCENHERLPKWCLPEYNLLFRLKFLYSPLGCHPIQFFRFDCRQNGFKFAAVHYFSLHLRALFPKLWGDFPLP